MKKNALELIEFIKNSPSCFHAITTIEGTLQAEGFTKLSEGESWKIQAGGKYYTTRNSSSIIAFEVGKEADKDYSFLISAAHSDSPTFKLKENHVLGKGKYSVINTEGYGGMICSTWLDRPLSVAGRIIVKEGNKFVTKLVNVDRDLLLIPNVAIHLNRGVNDGFAFNKQVDLLPLYGYGKDEDAFMKLIAKEAGVKVEDIYGNDLFLVTRDRAALWGEDEEFVSSPKLDDLECAFATLKGFLNGKVNKNSINVYCVFDNEEVGSMTKQGADGTFLPDTLARINDSLSFAKEDYHRALASSFLVSADNAHALHPNHPELYDPNNNTLMNEGIVIKQSANQKYTTDAVSMAIFKGICEKANAKVQFFSNRSDATGGSTLGNIALKKVSINSVDLGLAQLAMHSSYETGGVADVTYLIDAMSVYFSSKLQEVESGVLAVDYE